jgi:hypothetical protein
VAKPKPNASKATPTKVEAAEKQPKKAQAKASPAAKKKASGGGATDAPASASKKRGRKSKETAPVIDAAIPAPKAAARAKSTGKRGSAKKAAAKRTPRKQTPQKQKSAQKVVPKSEAAAEQKPNQKAKQKKPNAAGASAPTEKAKQKTPAGGSPAKKATSTKKVATAQKGKSAQKSAKQQAAKQQPKQQQPKQKTPAAPAGGSNAKKATPKRAQKNKSAQKPIKQKQQQQQQPQKQQQQKHKLEQSGNVASWPTAAPKQGGAKSAPKQQQGQQQRRQQQRPAVRPGAGRPQQQQQRSVSHSGAGGRSQGRVQPQRNAPRSANLLEAFMQKQVMPKKRAASPPQGGPQVRGRGKQTLHQQKQPQQPQQQKQQQQQTQTQQHKQKLKQKLKQKQQRGNLAQPPPFRAQQQSKVRASAQQRAAALQGASTAPFRKALSAAHQGRGVTSGSAGARSEQRQQHSNASAASAASDSGEAGSIWGNDTASIGWGYEGGSEPQTGGGGWGTPTDEWDASGADAPIIPVTGVVAPEVQSSSAAAVRPVRPEGDTAAVLKSELFVSTMKRLLEYEIHDASDQQMADLMSALLDEPAVIARQLVRYSEVASPSDTFEVRSPLRARALRARVFVSVVLCACLCDSPKLALCPASPCLLPPLPPPPIRRKRWCLWSGMRL